MKKKSLSGFTLIEVMIVIAIISILASLAAPSFLDSIQKRRLRSASETIYSGVLFSRSEAIKQNLNVIFQLDATNACFGIDDDNTTVCSCNANPGNCTVNGQQKVIDLSGNSGVSVGANISITFAANGMPTLVNGAATSVVPSITTSSAADSYDIDVNIIGSTTLTKN